VDLLASPPPRIELAADDSYRLAFELDAARHVYVYQQSPVGELVQLFPNDAYSRQENPVVAGERVVLPAEPDGLYVKGQQGEYRLTILAASEPMQELEALYEAYSRRGIRIGRREKLALVEEQLAALSGAQPEGMSVRVLAFEVH
jgi:hypothetical protein